MNRLCILIMVFVLTPKISYSDDLWEFSTYDNAFLECDKYSNIDACRYLLYNDICAIDPNNDNIKFAIAQEALDKNNDIVGMYLLIKSCINNNHRSCEYYEKFISEYNDSKNRYNLQDNYAEREDIEIYCSHQRDYRDKRTDPDWVEELSNYANKEVADPSNYDSNLNLDLGTSIVVTAATAAKIGKKAIKPVNHDEFTCRAESSQPLDYLIKNKSVIPIALFHGAFLRHSEVVDNADMVTIGDSIKFKISTIKSDLDYFGFYIPENRSYILWKFNDHTGEFTKLENIIFKDNINSGWSMIENYID